MIDLDITGKRFGKLVAIKKVDSRLQGKQLRSYWLFRCDCGKEKEMCKYSVVHGSSISCGCHQKSIAGERARKHGMESTRLYGCWLDMKHRCQYEKSKAGKEYKNFKHYKNRGIEVCNDWLDKENGSTNFINWALKNGYKDTLTLDRIDVNGNYCPENCRWVDAKTQANNKTTNHLITIDGETKTLQQWVDLAGISQTTYYNHKRIGLNDRDALFVKFDTHGRIKRKE